MNIVIVSDAWEPQVNGVVRTLRSVRSELVAMGDAVTIIAPDRYRSFACPTYPEIRLALAGSRTVGHAITQASPDAIHIATEGPLGLAARRWCLRNGVAFTTAYHTHFPDYVSARTGLPPSLVWRWIRWFHGPSSAVLASTDTLCRALRSHGITQTAFWGRGVDLALFRPDDSAASPFAGLPRPIQLYVGRVAVAKNIGAFLATWYPGTRVVVGDGPARAALAQAHPDAHFLGLLGGEDLAAAYRAADVVVFPSRTDTFGLVMIEALACGAPVAAYPVPGPIDVLTPDTGCMADDLETAIAGALSLNREVCAAYGAQFSWEASARQFRDALVPHVGQRYAA